MNSILYSKNSDNRWVWSLVATNGCTLAVSPDSYGARWTARRAAHTVAKAFSGHLEEHASGDTHDYPLSIEPKK